MFEDLTQKNPLYGDDVLETPPPSIPSPNGLKVSPGGGMGVIDSSSGSIVFSTATPYKRRSTTAADQTNPFSSLMWWCRRTGDTEITANGGRLLFIDYASGTWYRDSVEIEETAVELTGPSGFIYLKVPVEVGTATVDNPTGSWTLEGNPYTWEVEKTTTFTKYDSDPGATIVFEELEPDFGAVTDFQYFLLAEVSNYTPRQKHVGNIHLAQSSTTEITDITAT